MALIPVGRLRKPRNGERQGGNLVRHVTWITALKGKKPREYPGSQPGYSGSEVPEVG
jgi:hypothetical protein